MTEEIISRGHPRTYVRGVLSFDLEALDRWYGVNFTPRLPVQPPGIFTENTFFLLSWSKRALREARCRSLWPGPFRRSFWRWQQTGFPFRCCF